MKTLLVQTGQGKTTLIRQYLRDTFASWHVETTQLRSLDKIRTPPELTLVQLDDETEPSDIEALVPRLTSLQTRSPQVSIVMLGINREPKVRASMSKSQENHFLVLLNHIRNRIQEFPNPDRVDVVFWHGGPEMEAKLTLIEAKTYLARRRASHSPGAKGKIDAPRPSPLDDIKEVIKATEDLRVESGKLSAEAVAKAFGVSTSTLANWFGRSRQTVSKTPDADSLQNGLGFFERVARLRTVISKDGFIKWLRMRNQELDGKQPLELLARGEGQVVADLVDDMLTGAPA